MKYSSGRGDKGGLRRGKGNQTEPTEGQESARGAFAIDCANTQTDKGGGCSFRSTTSSRNRLIRGVKASGS